MYKYFFKFFFDFLLALFALVILSPFFILIFLALFFANNGNPFFFQLRPGLNEKIFKVIKFKTMNDKKDKKGNLLPDEKRLTAIGEFSHEKLLWMKFLN